MGEHKSTHRSPVEVSVHPTFSASHHPMAGDGPQDQKGLLRRTQTLELQLNNTAQPSAFPGGLPGLTLSDRLCSGNGDTTSHCLKRDLFGVPFCLPLLKQRRASKVFTLKGMHCQC